MFCSHSDCNFAQPDWGVMQSHIQCLQITQHHLLVDLPHSIPPSRRQSQQPAFAHEVFPHIAPTSTRTQAPYKHFRGRQPTKQQWHSKYTFCVSWSINYMCAFLYNVCVFCKWHRASTELFKQMCIFNKHQKQWVTQLNTGHFIFQVFKREPWHLYKHLMEDTM